MKKDKIPCRVCGKLFKPCSYCQSHSDVFRWRNFACSRECATKYVNDTIAYRKSLKNKEGNMINKAETVAKETFNDKPTMTRKKINKKKSTDVVEVKNEIKK